MAKNSIRDFDNTAGNNTDIQSVDIAENCAPSGINNAIRELMADMADVNDGTVALVSPAMDSADINGGTLDGTVIGGTTPAAGTFTTGDFNTSLNVDGTITSDGLTVDGNTGLGTASPSTTLDVVRNGVQPLRVQSTSGTEVAINMVNTGGNVQLEAHSGNFTIDADKVGLGTTSPSSDAIVKFIEVEDSTSAGLVLDAAKTFSMYSSTSSSLVFRDETAAATRMVLDTSGNLGIGTSSPTSRLSIFGSGGVPFRWGDTTALGTLTYSGSDPIIQSNTGNTLFYQGSSEAMRINSTANLLLRQTSDAVYDTNGAGSVASYYGAQFSSAQSTATKTILGNAADGNYMGSATNNSSGNAIINGYVRAVSTVQTAGSEEGILTFATKPSGSSATERMRIDSSGNLLVGKTTPSISTTGSELRSDGYVIATFDGDAPLYLNRLTSDGDIAKFYKDGSTVGSIQSSGGTNLHVQGTAAVVFTTGSTNRAYVASTGILAWLDDTYDLGSLSGRWDDVYATNGTIQTSDANEKQQIASLTDAEITAAKAISKLFKTFKWNNSVEEKGDAARTHTGVIAQDVQQAMTDAGLDAGDYAFFISATWWETQTEVPAVEAVEAQDAVYDDDGNLVSEAVEAVEAQDAYTRTDTYDTADEAPEGATERTRMGIRYPELLAFIGAATEQRLADIETRLTALETL